MIVRLLGLEKKILIEAGETPAVVYEMKKQVDSFREKLEVQHLNLDFYSQNTSTESDTERERETA